MKIFKLLSSFDCIEMSIFHNIIYLFNRRLFSIFFPPSIGVEVNVFWGHFRPGVVGHAFGGIGGQGIVLAQTLELNARLGRWQMACISAKFFPWLGGQETSDSKTPA